MYPNLVSSPCLIKSLNSNQARYIIFPIHLCLLLTQHFCTFICIKCLAVFNCNAIYSGPFKTLENPSSFHVQTQNVPFPCLRRITQSELVFPSSVSPNHFVYHILLLKIHIIFKFCFVKKSN